MELPEVQHLEDPQNRTNVPVAYPWRMAARNTFAALLGIGALSFAKWLEIEVSGYRGEVVWWMWGAAAAFAVVICYGHAALAVWLGGRRAGIIFKVIVVLALMGMLSGVWASLDRDAPFSGGVILAAILFAIAWFFKPKRAK